MEPEASESESFVLQVCHIPIVSSALRHVSTTYEEKKKSNLLTWLTCETCEMGLRVAAVAARPVVSLLQEPIDILNDAACRGLNHLTNVYPVLNMSSSELMSSAQQHLGAFLMLSPSDDDFTVPYSANTNNTRASDVDNQGDVEREYMQISLDSAEAREQVENRESTRSHLYHALSWTYLDIWMIMSHRLDSFISMFRTDSDAWQHFMQAEKFHSVRRRCTDLMTCASSLLCSRCHVLFAQFSIVILSNEGAGDLSTHEGKPVCLMCFVLTALQEQAVTFNKMTRVIMQRMQKLLETMIALVPRGVEHLFSRSVVLLDWLSNYPPVVWLVPDVAAIGERWTAREPNDADEHHVRYVPVHPVDLANNAFLPTPRRVYWRRRY